MGVPLPVLIGENTSLTTTDKTSLVNAVNEVVNVIDSTNEQVSTITQQILSLQSAGSGTVVWNSFNL